MTSALITTPLVSGPHRQLASQPSTEWTFDTKKNSNFLLTTSPTLNSYSHLTTPCAGCFLTPYRRCWDTFTYQLCHLPTRPHPGCFVEQCFIAKFSNATVPTAYCQAFTFGNVSAICLYLPHLFPCVIWGTFFVLSPHSISKHDPWCTVVAPNLFVFSKTRFLPNVAATKEVSIHSQQTIRWKMDL